MSYSRSLKRQLSSLLAGKTVYRACDEWGEILVIDQRRRRILTFGSVFEQSCMDRSDPSLLVHDYAKAMMLVMAFIDAPQTVVLLGVGGGAIIRSVMALHPEARIDAAELRPEVVEIARDWFEIPSSDRIRIHIGDAAHYLASREARSTDVLFSDLYHAHGMSPLQTQEVFLRECRRVLTDAGWLVMNVYAASELAEPFLARMKTQFAQMWLCTVEDGNQVLLASGRPGDGIPITPVPFDRLEALERRMNVRLDLLFRRLSRIF